MKRLEQLQNQIDPQEFQIVKMEDNEENKKFYFEIMNELPETTKNVLKKNTKLTHWDDCIEHYYNNEVKKNINDKGLGVFFIFHQYKNKIGFFVAKQQNENVILLSARFGHKYRNIGILSNVIDDFLEIIFNINKECKMVFCGTAYDSVKSVINNLKFTNLGKKNGYPYYGLLKDDYERRKKMVIMSNIRAY